MVEEDISDDRVPEPIVEEEHYRIITGKGSVIKYLSTGKIEILFANGNYSSYNP